MAGDAPPSHTRTQMCYLMPTKAPGVVKTFVFTTPEPFPV
jgi:hypothetical protein